MGILRLHIDGKLGRELKREVSLPNSNLVGGVLWVLVYWASVLGKVDVGVELLLFCC